MKRILNKIIVIVAATLFIITGCTDDLLDQEPRHTVTYKLFWKTNDDVEAAVNGMYALVKSSIKGLTRQDVPNSRRWGSWGDYFIYGDSRSGDWKNLADNDNDWKNITKNNLRAFPALQDLQNWRLFYRTIEQANQIITHVPEMTVNITEEEKNRAVAQALFVRAYIHFYMTRIWGDVPMNLQMENVEPLGRIAKETIWEQCIIDLEQAVQSLPVQYYVNGESGAIDNIRTRCHITKGTAWAIMAHIYMWQKEYQKAVDVIDQLEATGLYRLLNASQYRQIFDEGLSDEGIFEIFYSFDHGEYETYYGSSLTWFFIRPFTTRSKISYGLTKSKILEIYHYDNDARLEEFFMSIDETTFTPLPSALDGEEDGIMFAKYRKEPNYEYKFENNIMLIRYSGILLLKAEAEAHLGNSAKALEYLNQIKERAGIETYSNTDPELLIAEIIDERRRELIGESQRFYDLLRLGWIHKYSAFVTKADEDNGGGYWPIHDEAFLQNPEMTQNSFWE